MEFWKINGNGNDFITIDAPGGKSDGELSALARRLCRRRASIGADGLLVLEPSNRADFKMRLFNADGSEAEMCGNGARCIARYACEKGMAPAKMTFETLAGVMSAVVRKDFVRIDLGRITFEKGWIDRPLSWEGTAFRTCFLRVGVPHLVLFLDDDLSRSEKLRIGRAFRHADLFPEGTNVTFARPAGRGEIEAVTYERGVEGLTDSCGTGCAAAALSANAALRMESPVDVVNPGGVNRIDFQRLDDLTYRASLGGATAVVARGEVGPDA
ncbi:MAG: diaminopimelate epimerase [Pyramidobacter sp.]|jgi:diaminopimelate epimerase